MSEEPLTEGQVLGRYELLLCVAQGGMGRVWAARLHGSRGFRKLVALKTVVPGAADTEKLERMLLDEATLAAAIQHPNVAATFELGDHEGLPYLVMEWIDGETLHSIIREAQQRSGIPLSIGVGIVRQALRGLHAAHEQTDDQGTPLGIVHRDVSPHNILVAYSGRAKLVDFGVAKATQQRHCDLTEAGEIKGKLSYIAPEVVRGQPVDRRADIFSIGAVLYLVTTGRHPFRCNSPGQTLQMICSPRPVLPPSAFVSDYPPELESVVLKALHKNPSDRWATAREMEEALENAVADSSEGRLEARIAEFTARLIGERGVQRRKRIARAGELLDLRRAHDPTSTAIGSHGSLKAFMLEAGKPAEASAAGTPASRSTSTGSLDPSVMRPNRTWVRATIIGVGVASVLTGGFLALRPSERVPDDVAPPARLAARPPATPEAPAPPVPSPAPSASVAPAIVEPEREALAPQRTESNARVRKPTRVVKAVAPSRAAPPVAEAPPPAPSPADKPKERKMDAWNPSTYGGRL